MRITRIRLQKEVLSSNEHKPVISTREKGFFSATKNGVEKKIKKAFHRKTSIVRLLLKSVEHKRTDFSTRLTTLFLPHFLMISKMSLFIFQITLFIYPRVECRLSIKFNAANTCEFSSFEKLKCGFSKFPHVRAISKPYFSSRISLANKKHVSPCQEARIKKCPTQWNKTTIWDRYKVRTIIWSVPKKS